MSKVFVTQPTIIPEALAILEQHAEVLWGVPENERVQPNADTFARTQQAIRSSLDEVIGEVEAMFGYMRYDAALIEAAKNLKVIITPSSGSENVDVDAASANGVAVVNAAGAAYLAVSEHVIGLALSLMKRIGQNDRAAHANRRQDAIGGALQTHGMPGIISGKTIGVVGFGFIGREVARMARQGFRMDVLAFDPYFDPAEAGRQGVRLVELEELLATSDIVSINSPLTPETTGLIGEKQLRQMKPSSLLINTSRGGTVVTADLVAALKEGVIAGAGLDVTEPEPLPDGHEFFDMENVLLTNHVGGVSAETLPNQSIQSAQDGMLVLQGRRPFHLVNPSMWATRRGAS